MGRYRFHNTLLNFIDFPDLTLLLLMVSVYRATSRTYHSHRRLNVMIKSTIYLLPSYRIASISRQNNSILKIIEAIIDYLERLDR